MGVETQAERRRLLVEALREEGADLVDIMDAASPVPSRADFRDYIFNGYVSWSTGS